LVLLLLLLLVLLLLWQCSAVGAASTCLVAGMGTCSAGNNVTAEKP
jgi:hypothetical protein